MNTLYILQVQTVEGADYRNLYYPTKKGLDNAVKDARKNTVIGYYPSWKDKPEFIPVFTMRIFKMIEDIRRPYGLQRKAT